MSRMRQRRGWMGAFVALGLVCGLLAVPGSIAASAAVTPAPTALVLYDSTGPYAFLGDVYAMQTANLVGHFGTATRKKVKDYVAGEVNNYTATIYIGSTYDEAIPATFLADVQTTIKPVVWMYSNIWKLTATNPNFIYDYGWMWGGYDFSHVGSVNYKGQALGRSNDNSSGIMNYYSVDETKATVLATAVKDDGTTFPWAVRSKNLTYIGEVPYAYMKENDRYLIWSDMLFDLLAPATVERHRAMVRLEDVGPDADPAELRAIADYLFSKNIPFSIATYSWYRDPLGTFNAGVPVSRQMRQARDVVAALKYMQAKGGTIIQHGRTHQFGSKLNPYDGVSANDFEFYFAHVDTDVNSPTYNYVKLDGPVTGDSRAWATARMVAGSMDMMLAGLAKPTIFEFPHYAASEADYLAVKGLYAKAYDRRLYFPRNSLNKPDYTRPNGQFFPYDVTDVYGSKVIPENIGNYEPDGYNQHPPTLPAELVLRAQKNLVVRDGFASFFYHPYFGVPALAEIVDGINALGSYTWVGPNSI